MAAKSSAHLVLLSLAIAASCSTSGSSPGPDTASGGALTSDAGSGGVTFGGAGAGGATNVGGAGGQATPDAGPPPMTQMRFLQAYVSGGNKGAYDLWTRANGDAWYSVYRYLTYGQLTDFIQVPNGKGLNTHIWYVPAGKDPAPYYLSMTDEMNFKIPETDTGKHTVFSYYVGSPSWWQHMIVADADPRLTPPAGYAHVDFVTYAIDGIYPILDYGVSPGACVDRSQQDYYQRLAAGTYQFALYAGDKTNCEGSLIATTPATELAGGEVWNLYAMGDTISGFTLLPVKLERN